MKDIAKTVLFGVGVLLAVCGGTLWVYVMATYLM